VRTVKRRDYRVLMSDIRRLRPLVGVGLTILFLLPSLSAMATQDLSPLVVLARLVEAMALVGTSVWLVSAVMLHYSRIQADAQAGGGREEETHS
jgi:hypothetical protein